MVFIIVCADFSLNHTDSDNIIHPYQIQFPSVLASRSVEDMAEYNRKKRETR